MMTNIKKFVCCFGAAGLVSVMTPALALAILIGNNQGDAEFPNGEISFADAVVAYSPGVGQASPTAPHQGAVNMLGLPNHAGANECSEVADCSFVSLGDGGSITFQFTDNKLTGSGDSDLDLWIFEVGPDVEDTFVEISSDGTTWQSVGKVFGDISGIDIDSFGFGSEDAFGFVRLTDDPAEGQTSGNTVGADIDAVGAISTIPTPISNGTSSLGQLTCYKATGDSLDNEVIIRNQFGTQTLILGKPKMFCVPSDIVE